MDTTLNLGGTEEEGSVLLRISLAHALLLLILVIAAILRLGLLGALPLGDDEARQALLVWEFWQPPTTASATTAVSPAYFTLTAGLFALFGAGDALARLAPAIFGLIAVALPWLWRTRLGTAGALAASALLAVSPTMSMTSTTAGGDAMAVASTLLLFFAWMRFREEAGRRWLLVAVASLGFGLTTSPLFYSALLVLFVAGLLERALLLATGETRSGDGVGMAPYRIRYLLGLSALVFLLTATSFLWRPAGLGDAVAQLAAWLGNFRLTAGIQALALPLLALGRYELIVATLGAAAIFWASWRGDTLPLVLVYWFAATLILILLQQGTLHNVLLLVLPSYLLIGFWLNHVLSQPAGVARWALTLTLLFFGVVAYFNGARYLRVMTTAPQELSFLFLAFVALASGIVAVNFVRSWDQGAAYQGALVGVILLFAIYNWGTARWMLTEGGNDPREYWVEVGADDDLRMLANVLKEVSWQGGGQARDIDVLSAVDTLALRWYLREFSNAVFGQTVPPGSTQRAIISRAATETPAPGDDYLGTDLGLTYTGAAASSVRPLTITDTLRWWIFHEHPSTIVGDRIILWVRSDVLQ